MRALVIDDSATARLHVRRCLQSLGFSVVQASDAESGRACLTEERVDVVLLDWHMPGMSGLELLGLLREHDAVRDVPVLMITNEAKLENVARALEAGATEYIMKPFTAEALREKLALMNLGISGFPPAG